MYLICTFLYLIFPALKQNVWKVVFKAIIKAIGIDIVSFHVQFKQVQIKNVTLRTIVWIMYKCNSFFNTSTKWTVLIAQCCKYI